MVTTMLPVSTEESEHVIVISETSALYPNPNLSSYDIACPPVPKLLSIICVYVNVTLPLS